MTTETQSWIEEQAQQGNSIAQTDRGLAAGDNYAIARMSETEDDYIILYDTKDGHPLRVPMADRQYMLAKMLPLNPKERVSWFKNPNGRGLYQSAPSGVRPAYSETPPVLDQQPEAVASGKSSSVAPTGQAKTVRRRRKRGKRGGRKVPS